MSVEELAITHYKSQGFLYGNYLFILSNNMYYVVNLYLGKIFETTKPKRSN